MQLFLHLGDPVLLHHEKIPVELAGRVVVLVIPHIGEIPEQPRKWIGTSPNEMTHDSIIERVAPRQPHHRVHQLIDIVVGLNIDVGLAIGAAAEVIQPDRHSKRHEERYADRASLNALHHAIAEFGGLS